VERINAAPTLRLVNDPDARAHGPSSASSSAEVIRLLRAFHSVHNSDLRQILIESVETAAEIEHNPSRP
jgi:hypothetical protein